MSSTLTLILCPFCEENFVHPEGRLLCTDCHPKYLAGLALTEIESAVETLLSTPPEILSELKEVISLLSSKLKEINHGIHTHGN